MNLQNFKKMSLVFPLGQPRVVNMDQPFFRRLFGHSPRPAPESPETLAEGGSADAQFHLGLKCAHGGGAAQDYGRAAKWYLKAAQQNHALAQFNLAIMYATGQGVSKDDAEAEMWFGRAARQGDPGAQHRLGLRRHRASIRDVPEKMREARIEAYKWFILAAAQGYGGSNVARAAVALTMTFDDVTEATRRVEKFVPSVGGNSQAQ